jgi:nitrogen-specific signal transduction histidine kinase
VVVKMECAPRLDEVRIDPFQLDQVLLNLAANSRDAMPNGGVLMVEAASQEVTPSIARSHLGLLPGRYVTLSVRDTGCGMDANTRAHLFEPFFTTKEQGKGTGLGLTTVYGILAQAGGRIYVESEVGRGTEVVMFLPSAADSTTTTAEPHAARDPGSGRLRGIGGGGRPSCPAPGASPCGKAGGIDHRHGDAGDERPGGRRAGAGDAS